MQEPVFSFLERWNIQLRERGRRDCLFDNVKRRAFMKNMHLPMEEVRLSFNAPHMERVSRLTIERVQSVYPES
jgi:hypothetical protein